MPFTGSFSRDSPTMGAASYHSINHAIIFGTTGVITVACWQKRKIMNEKRDDLV
jgi:hypothetical protein